jgi:hypothetical protein
MFFCTCQHWPFQICLACMKTTLRRPIFAICSALACLGCWRAVSSWYAESRVEPLSAREKALRYIATQKMSKSGLQTKSTNPAGSQTVEAPTPVWTVQGQAIKAYDYMNPRIHTPFAAHGWQSSVFNSDVHIDVGSYTRTFWADPSGFHSIEK